MASKASISVFFPCYNDSHTIIQLVKTATATLKQLTSNYEIIVIDDGSQDDSREKLKAEAKKNPKLKLVFHTTNRGYGGVLKTGFETAKKDLVFYTDGDGQYDVSELKLLLNLMTDDVNFVNGIKMDRQDYTHRVVLGNLYAFLTRWLFLLKTFDVDCDFRLIRKSLVKKVDLNCTSGAVCVELVKKAEISGAKFRHVSVHHYPRKFGRSQFFRPQRLWQTLREIVPLWFKLMLSNG